MNSASCEYKAVTDPKRTRLRLKRLRETQPRLRPLIEAVPTNLYPSKEFLARYFRSRISYGRRSLVLRVVLGDPSLFHPNDAGHITLPYVRRVAEFFKNHPAQPLREPSRAFEREDIPKSLESIFGIPRSNGLDFLFHFGALPYLHWRRGPWPIDIFGLQLTQNDALSFLKPFYRSRLLSLVRAKALVRGRSDRNTHRRYFEAADSMLVLRNSLTYLQTLWACERRAGKLQNKIPQHVSQFFGVKRLSLPDIGFVLDILSLGHAGVMGVNEWSRSKDTLGLGLLLNIGTREPADIPMLLNNL